MFRHAQLLLKLRTVKIEKAPQVQRRKRSTEMKETLLFAAMGTGFTFLMTTLGASIVFFIKREIEQKLQRAFLGFAAGVMLAASLWSLLIPATEGAQEAGQIGWLPAAGGFLLGGLFLVGLDILVRRLRSKKIEKNEKQELLQENFLLLSAVTLHNIPEGMAVGLAFAMAADNPMEPALYAAAWALAFGIGIQNFPEGAAISLPLRQEKGISLRKSLRHCGACFWRWHHIVCSRKRPLHVLDTGLCCGGNDLCDRGRTDSTGKGRQRKRNWDGGLHGRLCFDDDTGCGAVGKEKEFKIVLE